MKIIFILCVLFLSAFVATAQTSCEDSSAILDVIAGEANNDDLVFVIAKPGKDENDDMLKRRLHNVKMYLTEYRKGSVFSEKPENIILSFGTTRDATGSIDIYFKGRLFAQFQLRLGTDLFVGECALDLELNKDPCELDAQKIFYPCIGRCLK